LAQLSAADRNLICAFHTGEQRTRINSRKALAAKLGLTEGALRKRAWDIRKKLKNCLMKCLGNEAQ
jgi:hypothetical protein